MDPRQAAPGDDGAAYSRRPDKFEGFTPDVASPKHPSDPERKLGPWAQEYLEIPDQTRIGICFSGGGIRSASYCLGALQVLQASGVFGEAQFLTAVSGGDYTAVSRSVVVAATMGDFPTPEEGEPSILAPESFESVLPFAANSPEERDLRQNSSYLARGATGKLWLGFNLIYGAVRHLLPFAAGLFLVAALLGLVFHRWLEEVLRREEEMNWEVVLWNLYLGLAIVGIAVLVLVVRQFIQNSSQPSGTVLTALRGLSMFVLRSGFGFIVLFAGIPALLVGITRGRDSLDRWATAAGASFGLASIVVAAVAYLSRSGRWKRVIRVSRMLLPFASVIVVGVPFIGFTYWVTQQGFNLHQSKGHEGGPLVALSISIVILLLYSQLDEVTPNMHLFYRERLARAFIRKRIRVDGGVSASQPRWSIPLSFSEMTSHVGFERPKLVVCAAVNASDESIPPGRSAGSFTFESDFSGSPLTGYVPTSHLEKAAGIGVVTMPGLMAISGAALAPSMGKMTRPALRLLMAIFNVRLGVWLPNPNRFKGRITASERRDPSRMAAAKAEPIPAEESRFRRPGALYALREAVGANRLDLPHVYVTDGGHFENLGLVELLRRGCGQILCFDAAGDDLDRFNTVSEAVALARSDLGVQVELDVGQLRPRDEESPSDHVEGNICFPDGTRGVLVFSKLAIARDAPLDAKAFRQFDRRFPTHGTADQFFNERKFESYRGLGAHAARGALVMFNRYRDNRDQSTFTSHLLCEP